MTIDLTEWTSRLEKLSHEAPTEATRAEVEKALNSKWEGIQVWAGRALSAWGDRHSIDLLRSWLERNMGKESGWAVRGEAVRALCGCYQAEDVSWLLDKYFQAPDRLHRYEFFPVLTALPQDKVRARIAKEMESQEPSRRDAAQVASRRIETQNAARAKAKG